ncbi:MAG: multiubiquitin domain-containing protein [Saprospiraceae bacterium]|nr:multiubiquitin domain-containing protein [Saprospiraceae bacterium]
MNNEIEIIDLEAYSKVGKPVPRKKRYRIRIDREHYIVDQECMLGRELLKLAGKNPIEKYQLNQKIRGGHVKKIQYDEEVCFTSPGVERYMTLPLDQTEG